MEDCIFCKIVNKEVPATIVHETDDFIAFNDINPRAKTHILIVPKKHIPTMNDLIEDEGDDALIGRMMIVASNIAKERGLTGHKLQFHVGKDGGQVIFHVHLHLMADQ